MKIQSLILSCLVLLGIHLSANAQRTCSTMENLEYRMQQDDKIEHTMRQISEHTRSYVNNPQRAVSGVITIPTVVHVIYSNSNENISNAQIQSQIDVLNEDFRRLNSDANNNWSQAADTQIEFCLASVDPNGNSTTGITRKSSSTTSWGTNDAMKYSSNGGVNAWPSGDYLNMWVCNIGGGILGYAQFPGGAAATDGVVMSPQYFGTTGYVSAPFDGGRTATHEVGHWLNLRHIWGDGGCNVDDYVSDTPTSDAANYGCASGHSSCNSTDMVQNYMDYSDDACMNLYTQGQKTRMRALFDTGGFRASLLNSGGCGNSTAPTCSDGVQNGTETGVDCGGSCPACPSNCSANDVTITITFDNYPEETSWSLKNSSGSTVASGGVYSNQADGSTLVESVCLANGCYDFVINDAYGDGICCSYGSGSYSVVAGGSTVASGGSFGSSETTNFCLGGTTPSCNDGVQNGNETGVDCGGSCTACPTCNDGIQNGSETGVDCGGSCSACPTCNDGIQNGNETGVDCGGSCPNTCGGGGGGCSTVQIDAENFESNWGIWNDGGSDCYRNNYAPYASSGSYTIRIRDNSGTASAMTTDNMNLSSFEEITIDFNYYPVGMENGEDFFLQGSLNGGSSWTTVATWAAGSQFSNGSAYSESVTVTVGGANFSSTTKWRFQCDASVNNDRIYIDDVVISGCANGNRLEQTEEEFSSLQMEAYTLGSVRRDIAPSVETTFEEMVTDISLYPNPTRDLLNIDFSKHSTEQLTIVITDLSGKVLEEVSQRNVRGDNELSLDVSAYNSGFYFVHFLGKDTRITRKFVVMK